MPTDKLMVLFKESGESSENSSLYDLHEWAAKKLKKMARTIDIANSAILEDVSSFYAKNWISVDKNGIPKRKDGWVLVYLSDGFIAIGKFDEKENKVGVLLPDGVEMSNVLSWMPLPNPPEDNNA